MEELKKEPAEKQSVKKRALTFCIFNIKIIL